MPTSLFLRSFLLNLLFRRLECRISAAGNAAQNATTSPHSGLQAANPLNSLPTSNHDPNRPFTASASYLPSASYSSYPGTRPNPRATAPQSASIFPESSSSQTPGSSRPASAGIPTPDSSGRSPELSRRGESNSSFIPPLVDAAPRQVNPKKQSL